MRVLRLLALALVALLLVTAVPATAATPEQKYANAAHTASNKERTKRDLKPLRKDECLRKAAQRQARRIAAERELFHQDLEKLLAKCGLTYAAENVAYGYSSGKAVVRGWMNSPPHRANLLAKEPRLMGIGVVRSDGVWYAAQVFGRK